MPEFEVQNLEVRPYKTVLAGFDLVLGTRDGEGRFTGACVVREMRLRAKDGGYWVRFPATLRRDKTGAPVRDAQGRTRYDTHVTLAKGPDGKPTAAARRFETAVTATAAKLFIAAQGSRVGYTTGQARPSWPAEATSTVFKHQPEQLVSTASDWLF